MKKLPQKVTLKQGISDMLLAMDVNQIETYDSSNVNFTAFQQAYYNVKKALDGRWDQTHDAVENLFTIVRLK